MCLLIYSKENRSKIEKKTVVLPLVCGSRLIDTCPLLNAHEVVAVKEENILKRNYLLVIPVHL